MAEAEFWQQLIAEVQNPAYQDPQLGAKAAALLDAGWMEELTGKIDIPLRDASAKVASVKPQQQSAEKPQLSISEEEAFQIGVAVLKELGIDVSVVFADIDEILSTQSS
jgi:hypothetical protein